MQSTPTDLVADTKFRVEFQSDLVYRFTFQSGDSTAQFARRKEKLDVWKKEKPVGSGSYGNIWLHRCLTSEVQGELQAVKSIRKTSLSSGGIDFFKEIEAIAKFSQRKYYGLFVEYFGWYENDDYVFIIMEYIQHGDLGSCLKVPLPEKETREVTFQVAEGLEELHNNGFVHRDLKPENVFVVRPGPQWWVKIGDFGFSKRVKENSDLQSMVGTRAFLAPEVQMIYPPGVDLESSATFSYSPKVDIWSLGVMVFYALFHEFPFTLKDPYGLPKYVRGAPFPFPTSPLAQALSEECRDFMIATMAPDAWKRSSARGVLESNWLKRRHIEPAPAIEDPLTSLQGQGKTLYEQGNYTAAEAKFLRAVEVCTEALGPTHEHTYASLEWVGKALYWREDYSKAEATFRCVFEGRAKTLGANHEQTLSAHELLGQAIYYLEDYAKAVAAFRETVEGRKIVLGTTDVVTLRTLEWLGRASYWHEDYPKAIAAFREAVDGRKVVLGRNHEHTLTSLEWLGRAFYYHEDYPQAISAFGEAVEGRKVVLGMDNTFTLTSIEWLGRALYYHEDYAKAEETFRETYKGRKAVLGAEHGHTWESLKWLGKSIH